MPQALFTISPGGTVLDYNEYCTPQALFTLYFHQQYFIHTTCTVTDELLYERV